MKRIYNWFICNFTDRQCLKSNTEFTRFDFAGCSNNCSKCGKYIKK
jgi:hypothetical protein